MVQKTVTFLDMREEGSSVLTYCYTLLFPPPTFQHCISSSIHHEPASVRQGGEFVGGLVVDAAPAEMQGVSQVEIWIVFGPLALTRCARGVLRLCQKIDVKGLGEFDVARTTASRRRCTKGARYP